MKALAEIQVIPIGAGVSVRKEVQRAYDVMRASGLKAQLHTFARAPNAASRRVLPRPVVHLKY